MIHYPCFPSYIIIKLNDIRYKIKNISLYSRAYKRISFSSMLKKKKKRFYKFFMKNVNKNTCKYIMDLNEKPTTQLKYFIYSIPIMYHKYYLSIKRISLF